MILYTLTYRLHWPGDYSILFVQNNIHIIKVSQEVSFTFEDKITAIGRARDVFREREDFKNLWFCKMPGYVFSTVCVCLSIRNLPEE